MKLRQIIIAIWFFSMVSILAINLNIFLAMLKWRDLILVYEYNQNIIAVESFLLLITISITLWLLYRYLIKQHYLDIIAPVGILGIINNKKRKL